MPVRDDVNGVRDDDGAERGGGEGHVRSAPTFETRQLVPNRVYRIPCALPTRLQSLPREVGREGWR